MDTSGVRFWKYCEFVLHLSPIEVEDVGGRDPPYSFRLTMNEYQRAKAFVRNDIPYLIRLVADPELGTVDRPSKTEVVAERVLRDTAELERVVEEKRFEEVVKEGYLNMGVE